MEYVLLLVLLLLVPIILSAWVTREVVRLRREVDLLRKQLPEPPSLPNPSGTDPVVVTEDLLAVASSENTINDNKPDAVMSPIESDPAVDVSSQNVHRRLALHGNNEQRHFQINLAPYIRSLLNYLREHWLVWVGAIALILGVTYLLQVISDYVEFTPLFRISAAFVGSSAVIALGERFHRKEKEYAEVGFAYVPAAVSGAGMTGLYCTIIFSYLLYDFLPPVISLLFMGGISVAALSMYLRLGPLIAILGLFGGFTAPLWFDANFDSHFGLAAYINIVALAGLLLTWHVRRAWLYPLILLPYYLWVSLIAYSVPPDTAFFWSLLYIPLSIYCLLGVPLLGWQLSTRYNHCVSPKSYNIVVTSLAVVLLSALVVYKIYIDADIRYLIGHLFALLIAWLPALRKERAHGRYLSFTVAGVLLSIGVATKLPLPQFGAGIILFITVTAFSLLMLRAFFQFTQRPRDVFLGWVTPMLPVVLCTVGWLVVEQSYPDYLYIWLAYAVVVNLLLAYYAPHTKPVESRFYAVMHTNIAIALWFIFEGNVLTLAIAAQVLLYAWHVSNSRFIPESWALKLIVWIALIRLTAAALVPQFQSEFAGQAGNLPLQLLSLAAFYYAYLLLSKIGSSLAAWLEGGLVHLVALTVFAQTNYWMSTLQPLPLMMDLPLIAVYCCQALILALIYHYRSNTAGALEMVYQRYSELLYFVALGLAIALNTIYSPLLRPTIDSSSLPVLNWLAVGWLIPALVVLLATRSRLTPPQIKPAILYGLGTALLAFWCLLSIRHFWQEESLVISNSTGMAEQFSYSLAGLTVGALATLFGMFRRNMHLVHLGLGLLIVVIVKVFIVDTSLLSGFWRAGSFLGLGAALVGLGWLFQRITESRRNERTGPTG